MKKTLQTRKMYAFVLLLCVLLTACSSDTKPLEPLDAQNSEIQTSFSKKEFMIHLNEVSEMITTTRNSGLKEDLAEKAIAPFIKDGKFIKQQLLQDQSLTICAKDSLEKLSNPQLALLSLYANVINEELYFSPTRKAPTNKRLNCISEAITGGGTITGGLTLTFIKKVGTRTALRLATSALGGMIGGAITAAMYINDYNTCMNRT